MPYRITRCYQPRDRGDIPAFTLEAILHIHILQGSVVTHGQFLKTLEKVFVVICQWIFFENWLVSYRKILWLSGRLSSHYHTRHEKTVLCVVSGATMWIAQLLLTCSDFRFSGGDSLELSGIQFTPPRQTRHRQDSFVGSGLAVWIGHWRH